MYQWVCPSGSAAKNLPAVQEMQIQSLGWEGPLEENMATHPSIFAEKIPWTEESGRLQSICRKSWARLSAIFSFFQSWKKCFLPPSKSTPKQRLISRKTWHPSVPDGGHGGIKLSWIFLFDSPPTESGRVSASPSLGTSSAPLRRMCRVGS